MWNRLRYTIWAPAYDALVGAVEFGAARRLSTDRLQLAPSDRVLIVGAGTGLDLDFLPSNVHVTAIDVTPAMLKHLERRAAGMGRSVARPANRTTCYPAALPRLAHPHLERRPPCRGSWLTSMES
jgi:SAM-dependent methyltransferase